MPTKAEEEWLDLIVQLGCIVCILEFLGRTPAEPHHMLSGGRRIGHKATIPLCFNHHRSGRNDAKVVSRDQNQRRFEARYGKETYLLEQTKLKVALMLAGKLEEDI